MTTRPLAFTLRRFSDADWMAFAGATSFPDGSDPLIAEVVVDGRDAVVIHDGEGASVTVFESALDARMTEGVIEGDIHTVYILSPRRLRRVSADELSHKKLVALGAKVVDFHTSEES